MATSGVSKASLAKVRTLGGRTRHWQYPLRDLSAPDTAG